MAENKKSFTAYCDWIDTFESLTDEEAGKLIKHVLRYVNDQNPTTDDRIINVAFASIKTTLKRDLQKWLRTVEANRENGKKGGRPRKPKKPNGLNGNPIEPKKGDSDSVSVSDSVNDNDSDIEERAHDFLIKDEIWLQTFQKKYRVEDWATFWETFSNKVDVEGLEFDKKKLRSRASTYAINWMRNQKEKSSAKKEKVSAIIKPMTYKELEEFETPLRELKK